MTGFGHDTLMNSILFLCAVIPSHFHGFYLSCTYFHRRRKARKGRYPGGPKTLIYSDDLLNGGLSAREVERRWLEESGLKRSSSRRGSMSRRTSGRVDPRRGSVRKSGAEIDSRRASVRKSGGTAGYGQPMAEAYGQPAYSWQHNSVNSVSRHGSRRVSGV